MTTLAKLKNRWLQARIAYHQRQAASYNVPVVRGYRRERYHAWLQKMHLHHMMKAHALQRELALANGASRLDKAIPA
jgi:hypothetical protein